METLTTLEAALVAQFGPLGPIVLLGALGLILAGGALAAWFAQPEDPMLRLRRQIQTPQATAETPAKALRQEDRNEQLQKFASFLEPKDVQELTKRQKQMRQAGYLSKDAVRLFHFAQFALGLAGLAGAFVYLNLLDGSAGMTTQQSMIYTMAPGLIGYYLPTYWVTRRVDERKEAITRGFPDSLDMMLVCVEAGQSLDQSIVRVARELKASCPPLALEYEIVAYELKAGKDRVTVLNDMAERCGVQDVQSFVTVLVQSASFGTSISEALRVYAAEMRDKRVMRAEEAANKLPTKMTLATMGLTVPPLLIILVGPSVHGITQLGQLSGN